MEMRKLKLALSAGALALSLALAGCGGGGSPAAMMEPEPSPQETCENAGGRYNADMSCTSAADLLKERQTAQRKAISDAISTATSAVAAVMDDSPVDVVTKADNAISAARKAIEDAGDVPENERASDTRTVDTLAGGLALAKTSRTKAMNDAADENRMVMNAMASKLYAGLGSGSTALDNATVAITAAGMVTGDADADNTADVTFKMTDAMVMGYGAWKGTEYEAKADGATDHAVVYSNQAPPGQVAFAEKYPSLTSLTPGLIRGGMFATGATGKDHTDSDGETVVVSGTYDGAPGAYHCAQTGGTACRSEQDGDEGFILTGTWTFKVAEGAMVDEAPSPNFVSFGWWSRDTGDTVDVVTFAQGQGTQETAIASVTAVTGTATYKGGAAGKYAIGDGSDAGAFTAEATLTAKFSTTTAEGSVEGMLTNFMSDGDAKGWTVELMATDIASGGVTGSKTVWSMGDDKAEATGSWNGSFRGAAADENDPPMTVLGEFMSEYGNVGRMTGAFGATKTE